MNFNLVTCKDVSDTRPNQNKYSELSIVYLCM